MSEKETKEQEKKGSSMKSVGIIALIVILLGALATAYYFYMQYQKAQHLLQSPTLAAIQESQDLITKVSALIELPTGEQPTIATVSDVTKLSDQPFFKDAKNGDKVLIFTKAKEAILYSPILNKIIAVGPVSIGNTPQITPSPTLSAKTTPKVTLTPTQ